MNRPMHRARIRRHPWKVTPEKAREIQQTLSKEVITRDRTGKVRTVAGVDVGFERNNTITRAAVTVLKFPELELHEYAIALSICAWSIVIP